VSDTYVGCSLYSESGELIGRVTDVIFHPTDLQPEWITVKPGALHREHLVPVAAVDRREDVLVTNVDAALIKHGPVAKKHIRPTSLEREQLISHYGLPSDT
jgi:uncharacterized protein YrrD